MAIEPPKKIYETPIIKKEEHSTALPSKKNKQQKKTPDKKEGIVDIKI